MTVLCPGGAASQPIPGTPPFIGASLALIDVGLVTLFGPIAGAVLSGAIDGFVWNATNCSNDPPGFPTWTDDDWKAAIGGILNPGYPALRTKVNNAIQTWLWYRYCQCVPPAVTPAQPTPPGTPPSTIIPVPLIPCGQFDVFGIAPPNQGFSALDSLHPIPAGATSYTYTSTYSPTVLTCSSGSCGMNNSQIKADGVTHNRDDGGGFIQVGVNGIQFQSSTFPIISGSSFIQTSHSGLTATDCPTVRVDEHVIFNCSPTGATTTANQPCVPCNDPSVTVQLGNLTLMVRQILNSLPGQQTGWIESTFHGNLSGDGAISVNALTRAVRVNITTDNPNLRTGHGDPTYLFDRGFIVPIGAEGSTRGLVRLVYNPQLYLLPALTTQVGYSTGVGITISITELLPSP